MTSSRRCAPPAWSWDRWWPAAGALGYRCREDAPSARVRSTCTSRRSSNSGASIHQEHGYIEAVAPNGLKGGRVHFDRITVTGTEDMLMAATLADGETVIENAAREPEVVDLADMLLKMGAKIEGAGTSTIRVQGVAKLHGAEHEIIADRIEAGTYMIAGAITGGEILVTGCVPEHLGALDHQDAAGRRRRHRGESNVRPRASQPELSARSTSTPKNIPALPPICKRSTWR